MERNMNRDTFDALQEVGFDAKQAAVLATAIPDSADFVRMEGRLIKWMVGIFVTFTTLMGGWIAILVNLASSS